MNKTELQFNAYCCKVMKNCKINYLKRNKQSQELCANHLAENDVYFQVCMKVGREKFYFADITLVESLALVSKTKKSILLYYYCAEMRDIEIARLLHIPRSTVNYLRRQALVEVKKIYERIT